MTRAIKCTWLGDMRFCMVVLLGGALQFKKGRSRMAADETLNVGNLVSSAHVRDPLYEPFTKVSLFR